MEALWLEITGKLAELLHAAAADACSNCPRSDMGPVIAAKPESPVADSVLGVLENSSSREDLH